MFPKAQLKQYSYGNFFMVNKYANRYVQNYLKPNINLRSYVVSFRTDKQALMYFCPLLCKKIYMTPSKPMVTHEYFWPKCSDFLAFARFTCNGVLYISKEVRKRSASVFSFHAHLLTQFSKWNIFLPFYLNKGQSEDSFQSIMRDSLANTTFVLIQSEIYSLQYNQIYGNKIICVPI